MILKQSITKFELICHPPKILIVFIFYFLKIFFPLHTISPFDIQWTSFKFKMIYE